MGGSEVKKSKKDKKDKKSKQKTEDAEIPGASSSKPMTAKTAKKKLTKKLGREPTEAEVQKFLIKKEKKRKEAESGEAASAAAETQPAKKQKTGSAKKSASATSTAPATSSKRLGIGGLQKDFYSEHPAVTALSAKEVSEYRDKVGLNINQHSREYKPVLKFEQAGFPQDLLDAACSGFTTPSPIQSQTWPIVLSGEDCIGIAETGSGKTLAFGLPGMVHVRARTSTGSASVRKPFMLVVAPTRELAVQTSDMIELAGSKCSPQITSVCIYGGVPKGPQCQALRRGVHCVIATPGRLIDLMQQGEVDLSDVTFLVLDEADRMLDMGFEKEIKQVMSSSRPDRQTLMFSATWPMEVQKIGQGYMKSPVRVDVGEKDRLTANHRVKQHVEVIEPGAKDARLLELLKKYHKDQKDSLLIFALYKKEAARLEDMLVRRGYVAKAIHGDLSQDKRTNVLETFKAGKLKCMIATDVAARGLDVPNLKFVINYTFPLTIEDYVHRIGRTGRAGATGTAHTLFTVLDKAHAGSLGNILREAGEAVPEKLMNFGQGTKRKKHALYGELSATQESMLGKSATRVVFD